MPPERQWPKMAEYQGRLVRLLRPIETRGGARFRFGTKMLVRYVNNRGLTLQDPHDSSRSIRNVKRSSVVLLPKEES